MIAFIDDHREIYGVEAYQFDWSHEDVEIAGEPMRVKVAQMRLCASRAVYVRLSS